MAILTAEQLTFLRQQKIPMGSLFDASGLRKEAYQAQMKSEEKLFAYGVTPCKAGNHTLRTRPGHCIQCDHSRIGFMIRAQKRAYVYIAASQKGRLIKVESTENVDYRMKSLNDQRYGSCSDWEMLVKVLSDRSGRLEADIQSQLVEFSVVGSYTKEGKLQQCYELFRCNFSDAYHALQSEAKVGERIDSPNHNRSVVNFKFR